MLGRLGSSINYYSGRGYDVRRKEVMTSAKKDSMNRW